ncbi:MAG: hypothetical protein ABII27_02020 [bacterium]
MLKGTKVLWEKSKTYYDLMVMREQNGYISFESEMQNEPVNTRDCHFNLDEIAYWDYKYSSEEELININREKIKFIGACDPSMGKMNKHGDYSTIITAAINK